MNSDKLLEKLAGKIGVLEVNNAMLGMQLEESQAETQVAIESHLKSESALKFAQQQLRDEHFHTADLERSVAELTAKLSKPKPKPKSKSSLKR